MTLLQQPPPQKMPICTIHTNHTSRPTVEEFNKHQQLLPFSSNLANEAQHILRSSVLGLMNEFGSARDSRGRTCNLCTGNIAESDGSKGGYLAAIPREQNQHRVGNKPGRMEERDQKGTTEVTVKDKTSGALESHSSVSCNNPKKDKSKTRRCITFFTNIKEATYLHVFC